MKLIASFPGGFIATEISTTVDDARTIGIIDTAEKNQRTTRDDALSTSAALASCDSERSARR